MYLSPFGDADLLGTHEVTLTLTLTPSRTAAKGSWLAGCRIMWSSAAMKMDPEV